MDDDVKTLLAILALVYGSSNGIGLFKTALDPLQTAATTLVAAIKSSTADDSYISNQKWQLFKSIWAYGIIVYVLLVLLPPAFLVLVVIRGAEGALSLLGLAAGEAPPAAARASPFYIVLLALSGLSSLQLLSPYIEAWRTLFKRRKP